jgi:DNA topoisomerase-3
VPQLPAILATLPHPQAPVALERLRGGHKLSKAYVDRNKLTDHHAILPTGQPPAAKLSPQLRRIYDLVATRFVAIFLPDQVVEETTVVLDIGSATFLSRGAVVLETGWKIVEPARNDGKQVGSTGPTGTDREGEDAEVEEELPPLVRGQTVHVDGMDVVEKETRPPRPFTDATLLGAMKNAGRDIDDEVLAAAMKESGLGTPATRAEMIEKLIRSAYMQRQGRQLHSTSKGQALIGLVPESLRSPELTAEWEQQLKDVEDGTLAASAYYQRITDFVRALVPRVAQGPALSAEHVAEARAQPGRRGNKGAGRQGGAQATDLGACPLCAQGAIVETAKAYGCSRYREGCGFTIWKRMGRRKLPKKVVRQLIREGGTERLEGLSPRLASSSRRG